jgi:hypothetical protein
MARRRTYGFSFSWKRALGISAAKGRISRSIGVPLTRSGRRQKLGRMVESGSIVVVVAMIFTAAAGLVVGLVNAIASIVVAASRSRSRRASDVDVRKGTDRPRRV